MPLALLACRGEVEKHSCVKCEAQRTSMRSSGLNPSDSALILGALCFRYSRRYARCGKKMHVFEAPIRVEEEGPVSI
jgi:hypothetical protein